MATTNMKRIAANALANYISSNISGLTGKVSAVVAGPEANLACLAVKILPDTFVFEPTQWDEVYFDEVTDDKKVVVDVGQFVGRFTIELYTTSPAEREQYEQAILDLFLATEWAPGTLFIDSPNLTIGGYASLHKAEIKYRLENEAWIDEMAFESKRYCFLEIFVDYPALIVATAPTIETLQIWLSENSVDAYTVEVEA